MLNLSNVTLMLLLNDVFLMLSFYSIFYIFIRHVLICFNMLVIINVVQHFDQFSGKALNKSLLIIIIKG